MLTQKDLDRIGDKVEIAVSRALEKHSCESHHGPEGTDTRLGKVEKQIVFWRGAGWLAGGVVVIGASVAKWFKN